MRERNMIDVDIRRFGKCDLMHIMLINMFHHNTTFFFECKHSLKKLFFDLGFYQNLVYMIFITSK